MGSTPAVVAGWGWIRRLVLSAVGVLAACSHLAVTPHHAVACAAEPVGDGSGRASTAAIAAAAAAPRSPAGACLLRNGLAYGPFRDGQGPDAGVYPTIDQIREDLRVIGRLTKRIRTYSSAPKHLEEVPRLAREQGIAVSQGIHLGENDAKNRLEIRAAVELAQRGLVESIIVGNEVLTFQRISKQQLVQYIREVRTQVPKVRVSTAEPWSTWERNPDLAREVDYVVAHFYPFWEGEAIEGAAMSAMIRYESLRDHLQRSLGRAVEIVIGETGWPSGGRPGAKAVPSPENQRRYFEEFTRLACERSVPFYYFAAFDEEWKWREGTALDPSETPRDRTFSGAWIGSSWGLLRSSGVLKRELAGLLERSAPGTRSIRDIFVDGRLAAGYGMGVDSSHERSDWLSNEAGDLRLSYPAGQQWGATFITVGGDPIPAPRPWKDFSKFHTLSIAMRGERGGETVEIGVKDYTDPDNGQERRVVISGLGTKYCSIDIPLTDLATPKKLTRLYVVAEFVFAGPNPQTVYVRDVRYKP